MVGTLFTLISFLFCIPTFYSISNNIPQDSTGTEALVKSNYISITAEEFELNYLFGHTSLKKMVSREEYLQFMIYEKLFAIDGLERRIDTTKRFLNYFNEIKADLMTEELYKDEILSQIQISQEEIDTVVIQKQLELEIRWLFAENENKLVEMQSALKSEKGFDSLFNSQLNDSVFIDHRSMKIDRYQLGRKNPELSQLIDSLKAGNLSNPVKQFDGYYIFKIDNIIQNNLITETEQNRLVYESERAVRKGKMDLLSDQYVHALMLENNPVIKRDAFNILKGYLGKYELDHEKYIRWQLDQVLTDERKKLEGIQDLNLSELSLIRLDNFDISLGEFLNWYWNRKQYLSIEKGSLDSYSNSLENLIWRMVRDRLLTIKALEKGYDQNENVLKQEKWWKDKIIYSIVKEDIANSLLLEFEEVDNNVTDDNKTFQEKLDNEFNVRLFRKITELKSKYDYSINSELLNSIALQEEGPEAIELYTVKKGGLIPRAPYPTVDREWGSWK